MSSLGASLPALIWVLWVSAHIAGVLTVGVVLFRGRTPQGTVAWILSLLVLPMVAVPAYWLFGRLFFEGYRAARRKPRRSKHGAITPPERLTGLPQTIGNSVEVLEDGEETFSSMFEGLARARHSIVVQFYIIREDRMGRALQNALLDARRRGVRVYLLMDWVGCQRLPRSFDRTLRAEGVQVERFRSSWGRIFRFQLKFRNHRKILVVDGEVGWLGGLNLGDEYRGLGHDGRAWRDTHLRVRGPAAQDLQQVFQEDWYWATGAEPEGLSWPPRSGPHPPHSGMAAATEGEGLAVTVVPSGPADRVSVASLTMLDAIHSAKSRLWITTAYFVPDAPLMAALQLAALRGVDVRILVPERGDLPYMDQLSFAFFGDLLRVGVKVYRYSRGILHAKTTLVDDSLGIVGTANLDPRSLYLNFEVTALLHGQPAVQMLARLMENDLLHAAPLFEEDVVSRPFLRRLQTRVLYLLAPAL